MSSPFPRPSSPRPASPVCTATDAAWTRTPVLRGILKLQRRASNASKTPDAETKHIKFNDEPMVRYFKSTDDVYGNPTEEPQPPPRQKFARKATGKMPDWIAKIAKTEADRAAQNVKVQIADPVAADKMPEEPQQPPRPTIVRKATGKTPDRIARIAKTEEDEAPQTVKISAAADNKPEERQQPPRIARKATGKTPDWIVQFAKSEADRAAQAAKTQAAAAAADDQVSERMQPVPGRVTVPVQRTTALPVVGLTSDDGLTVQLGPKLLVPVASLKQHFVLEGGATVTMIDIPPNRSWQAAIPTRKLETVTATTDSRLGLGLGPAPSLQPPRRPLTPYSLASRHCGLESEEVPRSVSPERTEEERATKNVVESAIFLRHHLEGPIQMRIKHAIADLDIDTHDAEARKDLAEEVRKEMDNFVPLLASGDLRVRDHVKFLAALVKYILEGC